MNCYKSLPNPFLNLSAFGTSSKINLGWVNLLFSSLEINNLKPFCVFMTMAEIVVQRIPEICFGRIHVGDLKKMEKTWKWTKTSLTGLDYRRWDMKQNIYEKQYLTNKMFIKQTCKTAPWTQSNTDFFWYFIAFIYLNSCLSVMLDSVSSSISFISFLTNSLKTYFSLILDHLPWGHLSCFTTLVFNTLYIVLYHGGLSVLNNIEIFIR